MDDFKTWKENKSYCHSFELPEMYSKFRVCLGNGVNATETDIIGSAAQTSPIMGGFNVHYF